MVDVHSEILTWSPALAGWQRDALRRVITQEKIEAQDVAELVAMAKAESGIAVGSPPTAVPLKSEHLSQANAAGEVVTLEALEDLKHVNALAENQRMTFAQQGVTAVYGENGTGKSGYCRVLGRACRGRRVDGILPNIQAATSGKASARFTVRVGAELQQHEWVDGVPGPAALARIAVFDRRCELAFINEEGEPTFLPAGLDVFNALVGLVEKVKKGVEDEERIEQPKDRLIDLPGLIVGDQEVEAFVSHLLGPGSKDRRGLLVEVDRLAASAQHRQEYDDALKRSAELQAKDPTARVRTLRSLVSSVARFRADAAPAIAALGVPVIQHLREAHQSKLAATQAAETAAAAVAVDKSGLATPLGLTFLRAAEQYATSVVHTGHPYPDLRPDARCPMCEQELGKDARARFERFQTLLNKAASEQVSKTTIAYEQLVAQISAVRPPQIDEHVVNEVEQLDAAAASAMRQLSQAIVTTKSKLLMACQDDSWGDVTHVGVEGITALRGMEAAVTKTATDIEALSDPKGRETLKTQLAKLKSRIQLADQKARIITFINQSCICEALTKCASQINTKPITTAGSTIAGKAMSGGLVKAFEEELKALGAVGRVKATINKRGEKGRTLYGIRLAGAAPLKWSTSQVLSEGEQRVVALAYFLAEARMAPHKATLVIDDPVCSLDHRWARQIGARLVKLAKDRQIIVFTHNISFFTHLGVNAVEEGTPLHRQYLYRGAAGPGYCDDVTAPWEKLEVGTRVTKMSARIKEITPVHAANPDGQEYRDAAGQLASHLRAAWERAVEEFVFNLAVERFGFAVKTMSLAGVVCDEETYKTINDAMTRLSAETPAHDHAAEDLAAMLTPDELRAEIQALESFVNTQKGKRADAEKKRRALGKPPPATVAKPAADERKS